MRSHACGVSCCVLFVIALSILPQCFAQAVLPAESLQVASLRASHELIWQRTSPSAKEPSGPVLYQIIFRSSATPGNIPLISPQFTLTNSHISDNGSAVTFSEPVNFASGGNFPVQSVNAGTGIVVSNTSGAVGVAIKQGGVGVFELNSNGAPSGAVLTANGIGGVQYLTMAGGWSLAGNAATFCSTSPCAAFLGTPAGDPSNMEIDVGGNRAMRLEQAADSQFVGGFAPNVIGGSSANAVTGAGTAGAVIAGGGSMTSPTVSSPNTISASFGFIGGGIDNSVSGNAANVVGGRTNTASGTEAVVGGGESNTASGNQATVGGGSGDMAGGTSATVSGGSANQASANFATIAGGRDNSVGGAGTFAAGQFTSDFNGSSGGTQHSGDFLFGDGSTTNFVVPTADNQFVARVAGGAIFYSNSGMTTGVSVAAGGGSWSSVSDRNVKANFTAIDPQEILARLLAMPVTTWNYKSQATNIRHIGPMAQDFYSAFAVGEDNKHITEIDEGGVAFAAIQGLNQKLEHEIGQQDAQIVALKQQLRQALAVLEKVRAELARR